MRIKSPSLLILFSLQVLFSLSTCKSSKPAVSAPEVTVDESDTTFQRILAERMAEIRPGEAVSPLRGGPEARDNEKFSVVPVFFATDRRPTGNSGPYEFFSGSKGDGNLKYGRVMVSIPRIHALGEIERPRWWKLEFKEDVEKHMVLKSVQSMSEGIFFGEVNRQVPKVNRSEGLVYIHGFNTSFDDAALRAAQMAYDISFEGIPFLYSWPSQGSLLNYWNDGENNEWTIPHLTKFLEQLATRTGLKKIHIVAHSMGNRAFTQALVNISEMHPNRALFGQVILAAPDVNTQRFIEEIAPRIQSTARNITLYASSKDKALLLSQTINKGPRAGEAGPRLVVLNGIETIDVSNIDTDFLGHSYYANTWTLINDLYHLLNLERRAGARQLKTATKNGLTYWKIE